jgi:hypothetical protein
MSEQVKTGAVTQVVPAAARETGFAEGAHVVLRPVMEGDLPELAKLLAANPCDDNPLPWTLQRLKKKFEDKDEPGLWGKSDRYFAVVRLTGGLAGFLRERQDQGSNVYWNQFYIDAGIEDYLAAGCDALAAYLAYKRKWSNPPRVSFEILSRQHELAEILAASVFEFEIALDNWMLHSGQPDSLHVYSWLSDEVLRNLADDGPVAGEEEE